MYTPVAYIAALIFTFNISSCNTNNEKAEAHFIEENSQEIIVHKPIGCSFFKGNWSLISSFKNAKSDDSINRINKAYNYHFSTLHFDINCGYEYRLEVNSCGVGFQLFENDSISFTSPTCTEACCDSDLSQKAASILTIMNKILYYSNDTIKLLANQPFVTEYNYETASLDTTYGQLEVTLVREIID